VVFLCFAALSSVAAETPPAETVFNHCCALATSNNLHAAIDTAAAFLTNPAARAALAQPRDESGEPWALLFYSYYYWWLLQAAGPHGWLSTLHSNEIETLLARYADAARGKRWTGYKCLINRLAQVHPHNSVVQVLNTARILEYDPADQFFLRHLLRLALLQAPGVRPHADAYVRAGGAPFPELLVYQARTISNAHERFTAAVQCLAVFPTAAFDLVCAALDAARDNLDTADRRALLNYYDAIIAAALRQPRTAAALPTLARLLAEQQRIEALIPALTAMAAAPNAPPHLAHARAELAAAVQARSQEVFSASATISLLDALFARIADTAAEAGSLASFTNALALPGVPMQLFQRALTVFWRARDYPRAEAVFRLLAHPCNPDGYTAGAAHYFLGHVSRVFHQDLDQAFVHFLTVPAFPACLVYTADAYLQAASILMHMNMPIHALALLAVDVPCVDFADVAALRHIHSACCRLKLHDATNAVRHLQTALALQPTRSNDVLDCCSLIPGAPAIWDAVATQRWCAADATAAIEAALTNRWDTPDDQLFLDALLHDWPARDEIPLHIATNRVLNNNIFPRRVRAVRGLNYLTQGE